MCGEQRERLGGRVGQQAHEVRAVRVGSRAGGQRALAAQHRQLAQRAQHTQGTHLGLSSRCRRTVGDCGASCRPAARSVHAECEHAHAARAGAERVCSGCDECGERGGRVVRGDERAQHVRVLGAGEGRECQGAMRDGMSISMNREI